MSTYFSLSGFEPATDTQIKAIDAAKSPADYDVKKSLDMGWQIATGADKQSFNATYSTMPADVAAKVATWSATPRATPPPQRPALAPKIFVAVAIAGGVIALTMMARAWWPTTAQ